MLVTGHVSSRYRFDRELLASLRDTGEAGWVSVRTLLDTRGNKSAQRCRDRLAAVGKLEVDPGSADLLRLPRLVVISTVLDEKLYLHWGTERWRRALPGVSEALRSHVGRVCEDHPLATLELVAIVCCPGFVDDIADLARAGLALTSGYGGTVEIADLCGTALKLGVFTGSPTDLYATVAALMR